MPPAMASSPMSSMRHRLTVSVLCALLLFLATDAALIYRTTLSAVNSAFDRTLLAAAKAISDTVRVEGSRVTAHLPYASLDAFEAMTQGRIVYRVTDPDGRLVSGLAAITPFEGEFTSRNQYPALVEFYEERLESEDMRVAALLHPVYLQGEYRMVQIQVAETLELRRAAAQRTIRETLRWQLLMLIALAVLIWYLVGVGLEPLASLGRQLRDRSPASLTPLAPTSSKELTPLVDALNDLIRRLRSLLDARERFVRDASHQLRTPLAVLKTQVQNARTTPEGRDLALAEIETSVDRATRIANQMLSLARVAASADAAATAQQQRIDVVALCRDVVIELSPLIAKKSLDLALEASQPVSWRLAHDWMLRELVRNLVSNAVKYTPYGGRVGIEVATDAARRIAITVWDSGPGMSPERLEAPFQPFVTSGIGQGAGLGLVICRDIALHLNASLEIENRIDPETGAVLGLTVRFITG